MNNLPILEFHGMQPIKASEYSDEIADFLKIDRVSFSNEEVVAIKDLDEMALHVGQLGGWDVIFLFIFGKTVPAKNVVEVGTSTGFSAFVLANALSFQNKTEKPINLRTLDIRSHFSVEKNKRIGYLLENWSDKDKVNVEVYRESKSILIPKIFEPKSVQLAFIDGNHEHPWALQDLLNIIPVADKNAVIIFHDIALPEYIKKSGRENSPVFKGFGCYGAKYIFDNWPLPKIKRGNIGAITLPDNTDDLKYYLKEIMEIPFEVPEGEHAKIRLCLEESFENVFGK